MPLAALTVSEGSIYGRFGFGPATRVQYVEVDTSTRFALREPVDGAGPGGRIELVEPDEAWEAVQTVFAGFHRSTRGSVERPEFYRHILTGAFDFRQQGPDRKLRAAVHLDDACPPGGDVVYSVDRSGDVRAIDVTDFVALTPAVYLRLWGLPRRHRHGAAGALELRTDATPPRVGAGRATGPEGEATSPTSCGCGCSTCRRRWPPGHGAPTGPPAPRSTTCWGMLPGAGRARRAAGPTVSPTDAAGIRMAADTLGSLSRGDVTVPEAARGRPSGRRRRPGRDLAAMADVAPGAVLRHRVLRTIPES